MLLMVFSHGLHWLYTGTSHDLLKFFGSLSLGDVATPVFFMVAGISLYLSLAAHLKKGSGVNQLRLHYRKRFGHVFFIGVCISLVWSVLQAQAVVLLLIASLFLLLFNRYGAEKSRLAVLCIALASLAVHQIIVTFDFSPLHIFLRGQFPFFAALGMSGLGFFSTVLLKLHLPNLYLVLSGGALLGVSQLMHTAGLLIRRYDASPSFIVFGLGLTLFVIGFLNSGVVKKLFFVPYLAHVGRDALFIFVLHYIVFFLPAYASGFYERLEPPAALLVSGCFVLAMIYTAFRRRQSSFTVYQLTEAIFDHLPRFAGRVIAPRVDAERFYYQKDKTAELR